MAIETALIKPVVDALMALLQRGEKATLKRNAEAALREAIRELLLANPDENKAQTRIAVAKAAGILSEDVLLAEDMLVKHRATKAKTAGKSTSGRARKTTTAKPDDKAPAKKPVTPRKPAKKP
jgi:hypothetical protein